MKAFSHLTGQQKEVGKDEEAIGKPIGYDRTDDNVVPFVSNGSSSCPVPEKIQSDPITELGPSHLDHIAALTAMELRSRYRREANSHKNMLSRRKTHRAIVHPDFIEFASFLRIMGPMPAKKATLDRIDNTDPEYAPGKVRWADKRTQNSNKSDTIIIHDVTKGKSYSVSELVKFQSIPADTIRKRKRRGWQDAEIIAGTKANKPAQPSPQLGLPAHVCQLASKVPPGLYSQQQLARMVTDDAFYWEAVSHQRAREEEGTGGYIASTYEELMADPDFMNVLDKDKYMKRYATQIWPQSRPHVVYSMLTPEHKKFFAELDPEWVKKEKEKLEGKQDLSKTL